MFINQKIFILGMARSGYEAAKILAPHNTVLVTDKLEQDMTKVEELKRMGVRVVISEDPTTLLDDSFDYLVKNPGIKFDHPCVRKAQYLKIPIINEVEVAYHFLPSDATIIGITGSNGKTTTTTLTYEFLKEAKVPVHLGGNIGIPVCALVNDVKSKDVLVLEISGHQLHDMPHFKTNIGVMTNLSEVHLDHFGTYENYIKNKIRIFQHHTSDNIAILNLGNIDVVNATKNIGSTKLYFSSEQNSQKADIYIEDNAIVYQGKKIIDIDDIRLKGIHNIENIMCAILAVKSIKNHDVDDESIRRVLQKFVGVEHRIEFVDRINTREFYNDSKSTNVKSTQVALNSFQTPTILLLGGLDRGLPFDGLKEYLSHVTHIVCYGETKDIIKEFATKIGKDCIVVDTLDDAVRVAYDVSEENDTILLSPACASWDQYKDFEERGRHFKQLVRNLKEENE